MPLWGQKLILLIFAVTLSGVYINKQDIDDKTEKPKRKKSTYALQQMTEPTAQAGHTIHIA